MKSLMIIARHGERVDRENKFEWTRYVESLQLPSETAVSFRRDPPLSVNGIIMARTLANSLKRVISDIGAGRQVRIYASRMHRTVQTAREIAKEFVVKDVHISSGLVRVLPNVNNSYQFESLEELLKLSPGINLVDCDDPTSQYHLSVLSWRDALEKIASRTDSVNVVVAHCETFHGLLGKSWTQTPCCCFGVFKGARSVSSTTAAHGSGIQGTHTTRGLVGKRPDKNRHRGGGVSSDSSSSSDGDADESDGSKGGCFRGEEIVIIVEKKSEVRGMFRAIEDKVSKSSHRLLFLHNQTYVPQDTLVAIHSHLHTMNPHIIRGIK